MRIQRLIIALAAFSLCAATNAIAVNNPFEKNIRVDIGSDSGWVIKDMTATRSGSDKDNNYYHLNYDRKQLRLRITEGPEDSDAAARQYKTLAIEDILVDGTRVPAFQWCLTNQQEHSRYLQQGMKVKNDVCINEGQVGTFYMLLNVETLKLLKQGKKLTFTIRPFRTAIDLNFDISDFEEMSAQLAPKAAAPVEKVAQAAPARAADKCQAKPPAGFAEIKAVEYECADAAAKNKAETTIAALVKTESDRRQKAAAEKERKRLAAEEARRKELEAQKAALAAEQAAIEASKAKQAAISNEIANKMISMCQKKWANGEHRCYCEKYLEHAPPGIESDPACGG